MTPLEPQPATASTSMTATVSDVDITAELGRRPIQSRTYADESRAFSRMAQSMGENPQYILQTLVEVAHEFCRTDSANISLGISLIELHEGESMFRWEALAGVYAGARNNTMPRHASACGTTIDRNATQLMYRPERAFPALKASPPIVEALLIPFSVDGKPIGTVWFVTHDEGRQLDREDERILTMFAQFASAGWQLRQALEAAKQRDIQKDEFVATLAHEFRNPLGPIRHAGEMLRMRTSNDPNLQWCSRTLDRQASHMTKLVNNLMDMAHITKGTLQLSTQPVDLAGILMQVVELKRPMLNAKKHSLIVALAHEKLQVEADGARLIQIFSNLLENAVTYMEPKGQVWLRLVRDRKDAVVHVQDAGMGISSAMLRRIFDPFATMEPAGARAEGGLGLGLMLVKMLVELHHGSIAAFSEGSGKGSEFIVRLPLLL